MNVADIITEYGAYYVNSGQNTQRLHRQLYYENDFDELFTQVQTTDTVYQLASSVFTRLAQPFQTDFTPLGDVEFSPAPIMTYGIKADGKFNPDELENTWLAFLASGDHDRSTWPFIRWLLEVHMVPKLQEDILLNEAYSGVYAAPTAGTPGGAGTAMNGVKKIINDHITAGDITPIATGAFSADAATFVGEIEAFVEAIPEKYRTQKMKLVMSQALFARFRKGQHVTYNQYYDKVEETVLLLYPNIEVHGTAALGSSQKIWCTPMENAYCVWKYGEKQGDFGIESEDRSVKVWTDFRKGYGFVIPQIVYTNDQDLV